MVIGEAETSFSAAKQRVFDIVIDDQVVITNFDIYVTAVGANKVVYLTNKIEHLDDSLRGPLTIKFTRRVGDAKFNMLEVRNDAGVILVDAKAADMAESFAAAANKAPVVEGSEIWKNPIQSIDIRVNDLISRMSLAEKSGANPQRNSGDSTLRHSSLRLLNEALHGVGRAGIATVFPQAIGMAATWDMPLIHKEGDVISTEARAKHNEYTKTHNGDSAGYYGLTFWSPNINIFRDPRWGRGQETYGEDTFLTGTIGVAFIQGLQGDDPNYLKTVACAKHFAVHSGPEFTRHQFDSEPPERDLYETYLPHF